MRLYPMDNSLIVMSNELGTVGWLLNRDDMWERIGSARATMTGPALNHLNETMRRLGLDDENYVS